MKLFFIRHGQTEWNTTKRFQGQLDSPLTKEGINQTKALNETMDKYNFQKIYSSPLGRTMQTAKILETNLIKTTPIENLKEMSFGIIEGMKKEEINLQYPELLNSLWNDVLNYSPNDFNGESYPQLEKRAKSALDLIVKGSQNALVIAHGVIMKVIFKIIKGQTWSEMQNEDFPHNTSITTVEYKDGEFKILDFSNIDHLKGFNLETFV